MNFYESLALARSMIYAGMCAVLLYNMLDEPHPWLWFALFVVFYCRFLRELHAYNKTRLP